MIYDFITIWGGAAWLFANINLPFNCKKLILERNSLLGIKVLMSWWERANFTNLNLLPEKYVSNNPKAVIGFLNRFTQYDIINFFESNWVDWKVEDNFRVITASGHARDIVNVLINKSKQNNVEISLNTLVKDVIFKDNLYKIITSKGNYLAKNVIIAVWWRSYPQTWTTGFGYELAKKLGLKVNKPYKWLVWIVTKEKVNEFAWTTLNVKFLLFENGKEIFNDINSLLFTHWWISGIVTYNSVLYGKDLDTFPENYLIKIEFLEENWRILATKKLRKLFNLSLENNFIYLHPIGLKSWKEAKVTAWGVDTNELTKYLESKKYPGLFFIWEVVDITWHTWWYNLQWAWSSAYCMAQKFN